MAGEEDWSGGPVLKYRVDFELEGTALEWVHRGFPLNADAGCSPEPPTHDGAEDRWFLFDLLLLFGTNEP
jgi:hypothetical protein